jgi:hypothetical protein
MHDDDMLKPAWRRLPLTMLSAFLLGCGADGRQASPSALFLTTPSGEPYGAALIGPILLDIEPVAGTRCYMVKTADGVQHGVVWPRGTIAQSDSILIPGISAPLRNGDTFWAGGGAVDRSEILGPCNKGPVYYLGPEGYRTDPRPTP